MSDDMDKWVENARWQLEQAVLGIAKFHEQDVALVEAYMDDPSEILQRWHSAYVQRDSLLSTYSVEQRDALAQFDQTIQTSTAKYKSLPPLYKFFGVKAGRDIAAAAAQLALALREQPSPQ